MEIVVLTAAILGGIRLGGGKGSVMKAMLGTLIVLLLTNGMLRMAMSAGSSRVILATILLLAALLDIRWFKNRHKAVQELYVSPNYMELPPPQPTGRDSGNTVDRTDDRICRDRAAERMADNRRKRTEPLIRGMNRGHRVRHVQVASARFAVPWKVQRDDAEPALHQPGDDPRHMRSP